MAPPRKSTPKKSSPKKKSSGKKVSSRVLSALQRHKYTIGGGLLTALAAGLAYRNRNSIQTTYSNTREALKAKYNEIDNRVKYLREVLGRTPAQDIKEQKSLINQLEINSEKKEQIKDALNGVNEHGAAKKYLNCVEVTDANGKKRQVCTLKRADDDDFNPNVSHGFGTFGAPKPPPPPPMPRMPTKK